MRPGIKFYKIKLIKKIIKQIDQAREQLFNDLVTNATDPTIFKRRLRMLKHLNLYENQLVEKVQQFQTDDVNDLLNFDPRPGIRNIINPSA